MSDVEQKPVHKVALGIEYDGSKYYGWQRQNEVRSVQENWRKRFRWRTNRLTSCVQGALTPVSTERGRWFTLKPPPCAGRCLDVGCKCEFTW